MEVWFYRDEKGAPVLKWLSELRRSDSKAFAKCVAAIRRLASYGHELRRPQADFLRDGIYELRVRSGNVHYRILYFFHGRQAALLTNGFSKEGRVPNVEIERAIHRMKSFREDPAGHTYEEDL